MIRKLHWDFETYSEADIKKAGAYAYATHPSTEVMICCYALVSGGIDLSSVEVKTWLPDAQPMPRDLRQALEDDDVEIWAHNAQFERAVTLYTLPRQVPDLPTTDVDRWRCTAYLAAAHGLGRSLGVGLRQLGVGVQKNPDGPAFIKKFCKPRKPTKTDARTRITRLDAPLHFRKGVVYCQDDVRGELALDVGLGQLQDWQWDLYTADLRMNEAGLPMRMPLARAAFAALTILENDVKEEARAVAGCGPTQRAPLLDWLRAEGVDLPNLQKKTVEDALKAGDLPAHVAHVLTLRLEAAKAGTKKLAAMQLTACPDDVIRGTFLIHGAHTGRWAGRLIQPQNFVRGKSKAGRETELIMRVLRDHDAAGAAAMLRLLFADPIKTLGQSMRSFIAVSRDEHLYVVDYAAIEARVLPWLAGQQGILDDFLQGVDVYCVFAAALYGVDYATLRAGYKAEDPTCIFQRQVGKVAVLGCGYGLGWEKFVEHAAQQGVLITEDFARKVIKAYRRENAEIVAFWAILQNSWAEACMYPGREVWAGDHLRMQHRDGHLWVQLPSGREMCYRDARVAPTEKWGKPAWDCSFETTLGDRITRERTYGGKLAENFTQAVAADVMAWGLFNASTAGYRPRGTVHDELLASRPYGTGSVSELEALVCGGQKGIRWAKGLPLKAEGKVCRAYAK